MFSLFRRTPPKQPVLQIDEVTDKFIRVRETNFFGQFSKSEDGRYLVAWSDSDPVARRGGYRESGDGSFLLASGGKVLVQGSAQRPNDGKVADTGTFIFNDWMFGDGLKGTFLAYAADGTLCLNHKFSANLRNNGISSDGCFAVCQLCASSTDDSGVLAFFDLQNSRLLWKVRPTTGWADYYSFRTSDRKLVLHYKERGAFEYDFNGNFLDQERWDATAIDFASGYELHHMAKAKLKAVSTTSDRTAIFNEALSLLRRALARNLSHAPKELASIHRTIGEIHELRGDVSATLQAYEQAIALDPSIGLKRRVASLRKGSAKVCR